MIKILIIDDEPDILEFLKYNLIKEGYDIYTALNGSEGLKIALEVVPDLIILDVMMPDMDGIETCRNIKEQRSLQKTMIVFLSARGEEYSLIAGFESGADDYIVKPIKVTILSSKIKAMFRRPLQEDINKLLINDLIIDKNSYTVTKGGTTFEIPKKEFELLFLLATKPQKVFTRDEIIDKVWGLNTFVGNRTIDVHVRKIRSKIGEEFIKTIKGVGYKFDNN